MKKYKLYRNNNTLIPKDIIMKRVLPIVMAGATLSCMASCFSSDKTIEEDIVGEVEYVLPDNNEVKNNLNTEDLTPNDQISVNKIKCDYVDINDYFEVGSSPYIGIIKDLYNTDAVKYIEKYSKMYGVDPNIMICICYQETCFNHYDTIPGGISYNGAGVGLMQIEYPESNNREISAYNYLTEEEDTVIVSMENAVDLEKNIQIGTMMFQKNINEMDGNIFLAIQSHNYGYDMIKMMIYQNYNKDVNEVIDNYSDISWVGCIQDVHNNPTKYIEYWSAGATYGNADYIKDVLRYCISDTAEYCYGNEKITFNLKTSEYSKEVLSSKIL